MTPVTGSTPDKGELGDLSANYLYNPAEAKKLTAAAGHNGPIPVPYYAVLTQGEIPEADQLVIDSLSRSGTVALDITRVPTAAEHNKYRVNGLYDGLIPQSGSSDDADYFVFRDYHSQGNPNGRQAFPDPRIDQLGLAQRQELDLEKCRALLKEFQMFMAGWMATVPGRHLFTTFGFRWPWLHNVNYGESTSSPPAGRPAQGGHLHWLDANVPSRDKPI